MADAHTVWVPEAGLPAEPAEEPLYQRLHADPRVAGPLVPGSALRRRIGELARSIAADFPPPGPIHCVVVLKGAAFFAKELGECLFVCCGRELHYHFVKASTYGADIKRPGEPGRKVSIQLAPDDVRARDVLLLDDLVDQGYTLAAIQHHLREREGVQSLRTAVLLAKRLEPSPGREGPPRARPAPDYTGFSIPDRWVAGFGIDAGEDFRNLPFIIAVNEEHYRHEPG